MFCLPKNTCRIIRYRIGGFPLARVFTFLTFFAQSGVDVGMDVPSRSFSTFLPSHLYLLTFLRLLLYRDRTVCPVCTSSLSFSLQHQISLNLTHHERPNSKASSVSFCFEWGKFSRLTDIPTRLHLPSPPSSPIRQPISPISLPQSDDTPRSSPSTWLNSEFAGTAVKEGAFEDINLAQYKGKW